MSGWRIGAALSLLVSAMHFAWGQGGPPGSAPPPVRVSAVEEREVAPEQPFVGTVMPLQKAVIGSAVDGRVVEFPRNEGDRVQEGEKLAQLLTETIQLEREAASAELAWRQAELDELKNGSRPEEIEQAQARMAAAKAEMEYTKLRLQRLQSLFRQGRAASSEEVDEATAAADAARNTFLEATAAHALAVAGPRPEKIAQAQARVRMQQAVVDRLDDQIKKHTIISRFHGYVTAEHTEVGAWVNRGDPVVEIVALDEVEVQVYVVENHVPHIPVGLTLPITVPALPDRDPVTGADPFVGTVTQVVPLADARSRTFPVKIRVKNDPDAPTLKAGMLASVWLPTGPKQVGTVIPKDALVLNGGAQSVWVIEPQTVAPVESGGAAFFQGEAKSVPVKTIIEDRTSYLVRGPIAKGQLVVVLGNERIRPSAPGKPPIVQWPAAPAKGAQTAKTR